MLVTGSLLLQTNFFFTSTVAKDTLCILQTEREVLSYSLFSAFFIIIKRTWADALEMFEWNLCTFCNRHVADVTVFLVCSVSFPALTLLSLPRSDAEVKSWLSYFLLLQMLMNAKCSTGAVTRSVSTSSAATVARATVVMPLKTAEHVKVSFPGPLSVLQMVLGDLGLYVGELGCAEQASPTS